MNTYVPIFLGLDASGGRKQRIDTRNYHSIIITIIIHYDSCKTSIYYITVAELIYSLPSLLLAILVTCTLSASCESVDSTYTIRLFLHTVTVRLFEALKLNRYNVMHAKPLNSTCA